MSLSGLYIPFSKVTLFSLYQKCSVDLKYVKNALAVGAPLQTPLGELTTLPQTSSAREGDSHSPFFTPLSTRNPIRKYFVRNLVTAAPSVSICNTPMQ